MEVLVKQAFFVLFSLYFCTTIGVCLLYPRDSESRTTKLLDGVWNFRISEVTKPNAGFDEQWYKNPLSQSGSVIPMPVPSSYNDITQDQTIRDFIGWAWYDREFFVPLEWSGKRVVLRFGSVHYYAKVYVNGILITEHRSGHLPFEAEVQDIVSYGKINRVTVAVDSTLTQETIPQGSVTFHNDTSKYPPNFYTFYGHFDFFHYIGIHRSVQLYSTPLNYISNISVTTDFESIRTGLYVVDIPESSRILYQSLSDTTTGKVNFNVNCKSAVKSGTDRKITSDACTKCGVTLFDKNGNAVANQGSCQGTLVVPNATLWWPYTMNPEAGYQYLMKVEVETPTDSDVYYQKVGIRSVSITPDQFLINNKPFYFTGFGKHEDANIRGKGLDMPLILKDFNLIKWIGANSFRTSHYPYSEELMDQADEQGVVVIDEVPAIGLTAFNDILLQGHFQLITETFQRDKNRPSVVMWSVANEPSSQLKPAEDYFRKVVEFAKSVDSTRPITAALAQNVDKDFATQFMDVLMINRYYAWYGDDGYTQVILPQTLYDFRLSRQIFRKPTLISEYGADTIPGLHASPASMFTEDYQTELMIQYHKAFDQLRKEGGFVGELIWNFADFMTNQQSNPARVVGNKKGIFTRERQPKASAKLLRCRYLQIANVAITDSAAYCPA